MRGRTRRYSASLELKNLSYPKMRSRLVCMANRRLRLHSCHLVRPLKRTHSRIHLRSPRSYWKYVCDRPEWWLSKRHIPRWGHTRVHTVQRGPDRTRLHPPHLRWVRPFPRWLCPVPRLRVHSNEESQLLGVEMGVMGDARHPAGHARWSKVDPR